MTRQVLPLKAQSILDLALWFERQKRVLPWRSEPTLYRVWVSEIMLQQTQVVTVLPYFERFMRRFPSVEALAEAQEIEVVEAWAGLGYYSRARNLHRAARFIRDLGAFPQTLEEWLEIPGVGPYTAGAIVSIALGQAEPILDGNVERVLSRVLSLGRQQQGETHYKSRLWRWSGLLVRRGARLGVSPSVFNQALMELGALICTPKNPRCGECPLRGESGERGACTAFRSGRPTDFPQKKAPKEWLRIEEQRHAWIRLDSSEWLLQRQVEGSWRAGLWDFLEQAPPAGKAKLLGEVKTRHVVTRHKIERTTQLWAVKPEPAFKDGSERDHQKWMSLQDEAVAGSSAYAKTRKQILAAAFDFLATTSK